MDERINILIGSDINYAPYYGVMLTSLFMNNKESLFDIYLLTDKSWDKNETQKFEQLTDKYHSRFIVKVVDEEVMKDFPTIAHITLPTYYRLQAVHLLPNDIHKILYLDGDIIVRGDIRPLWNTDLTNMAFAGVEDCTAEDYQNEGHFSRLNYDPKYGYYNAGVTLYNFDYWREYDLPTKVIQYLNDNRDNIKWMDQDAVNGFLHEYRINLPYIYNFQVLFLAKETLNYYSTAKRQKILEAYTKSIIVHYNGSCKPWSYRYIGCPFAEEWNMYMKKSLWSISKFPNLKRRIIYILEKLFFHKKLYRTKNQCFIENYQSGL